MAQSRKRKSNHKEFTPFVKGKLDINKQGMGFVAVEGMTQDILIRRENLKNAMNGDVVEVAIIKIGKTSKRAEGVIHKVLKRAQTELIGTVEINGSYAFVIPHNKNFSKDIFIAEKNTNNATTGDTVRVKIIEWNERMKNPEGIILDILTGDKLNDMAMKEILLQQGFALEFPKEVIEELESIPTAITDEEISNRRDMRNVFTLTIDPHDAKDFDDAISLQKKPNGRWELGIHIADVAHYVKPNTALDAEAYSRATSVYLPDRVLPMLPEKISNELCSLRPNEDKCTFSVVVEIDEKTTIYDTWMGRTLIHSNIRFTYEEAQEIIEKKTGKYADEILTLHNISQKLRAAKFEKGAINFSSEESRFILDEHGVPTGVEIKENNESHQLIEELMLLANRTVASYVSSIKTKEGSIPFPYRIHDTPDLDKLKPFATFASQFGHKFDLSSPLTIAKSFNKMTESSAENPEQDILHTLGIRTMAKAVYSTENIGHYGLAFEHYCHFTSPIRRYPDVLVHRILEQCLANNITPIKNMDAICIHCSERERKAMEAEREASKYKQVEFMQQFIGEIFDATISGVAIFGFWAQTNLHRCEGFISIRDLEHIDEFFYDEGNYALLGKRTKKRFQMGKSVQVKVAGVDLTKRQIDFELVE